MLLVAALSIPIGLWARKKGYGFWTFFFASFLFDPLTCVALLLALPKHQGRKAAG